MATAAPATRVTIDPNMPGATDPAVIAAVKAFNAGGKALTAAEQADVAAVQNWNAVTASSPGHIISQATVGTATEVGNLIGLVTSLSFWTRVGEVVLGAVLLILGLRSLTGDSAIPSLPHV